MTTPTTQREADERARIETVAKAIYRLFPGSEFHPWREGGNSNMQEEARRYARAAIDQSTRQAAPDCTEPNRKACPRLCIDFCNAAEEARAATDQPSAGQVDERALFEKWLFKGAVSGTYVMSAWDAWQARASLTPTAPQAASQQADEAADAFCDANCTWTDHHPECKFAAPQVATTATCQPSGLTGQPDATICQPAAATASASQVDPSMALPHRTLEQHRALAVDPSEGGHYD